MIRELLTKFRAVAPPPPPVPPTVSAEVQARAFAGARLSRYVQFQVSLEAAHKEIQRDLVALRAHSRDLAQNNVYGRKYAQLVANHVVGPDGITLESGITGNGDKPKSAWNEEIEAQWASWGKSVTADGRLGIVDLMQAVAVQVAVDGECFIRLVRGYPNACGFALEILDADRVDWTQNQPINPQTGERTIMGIQMDRWMRPTGYWMTTAHPHDWEGGPRRVLVPAAEIIHVYAEDRANGYRGIPWTTAVMVQLSMLGRLWNSELEAANADADRIAIVKAPPPDPEAEPRKDEDGNPLVVLDPLGMADELQAGFGNQNLRVLGIDPGLDITFPAPNHPTTGLDMFAKALLKGVSAGLGVAYHSLTADVADANYTASRVALLDERDNWRRLQGWFIRQVCNPIFNAWLEMTALNGVIRFPVGDWKKLASPIWWPRTWEWVDPEKEIKASILAIRAGLSTYQIENGALGLNYRKVFKQRAEEHALADKLGLRLDLDGKGSAPIPQETYTNKEGSDASS